MFTVLAFNIKIFDTFSICVSPPLSMKEAAKIMHICSVIIYPLEKAIHCIGTSVICNKQHPDSGCFGISGVVISSALSKGWRSGVEAFCAGHFLRLTETGNRVLNKNSDFYVTI